MNGWTLACLLTLVSIVPLHIEHYETFIHEVFEHLVNVCIAASKRISLCNRPCPGYVHQCSYSTCSTYRLFPAARTRSVTLRCREKKIILSPLAEIKSIFGTSFVWIKPNPIPFTFSQASSSFAGASVLRSRMLTNNGESNETQKLSAIKF